MPRPKKVTPELVEEANRLRASGLSVRDAAEALGVSKSALAVAMRVGTSAEPAHKHPPARTDDGLASTLEVEPGTPALEVMRRLLDDVVATLQVLPLDSPRRNPALASARQLARQMASLEVPQPSQDEVETQRRRADLETRREIERYVEQAERIAEERGVCVHCGQSLGAAAKGAA